MYQSIKKDIGMLLGFGVFSLVLSVVFGKVSGTVFNALLLVASVAIYFLCFRIIPHKRTRFIVYSIGVMLIGFPIFHLSEQYDKRTEEVQTLPSSSTAEVSTYQQVTSKMKTVTPEDFLFALEEEETLVLYVGRETCPYCTSFIHKMKSVDVSSVYYMDTEEKTEVLRFFAQKYELDSVPQLLRFQHQELVGRFPIDEDVQPEEIAAFIHG